MSSTIEIKHQHTGAVLYVGEHKTLRDAAEAAVKAKADLSYADLSSANLRSADLSFANLLSANLSSADLSFANLLSANLSSANLRFADLSFANLRFADLLSADLSFANLSFANLPDGLRVAHLCFGGWPITVTPQHTTIGCQRHDNDKWLSWIPCDVAHMHQDASAWWADHGDAIKAVIRNVMQEQPKNEKVAT